MKTLIKTSIATAVAAFALGAQANVVTSIKPLGFIASSIADGVTDVEVIVPAGASPHDYSLKPSDVKKVKSGDLVLWIGKDVDAFLDKTIDQLDQNKVIQISKINGVTDLLGKAMDDDDDEHEEHEHHHGHEGHDHAHEGHDHEGHDHAHEGHDHHGHHHEKDENGLTINWHVWYSPAISKLAANELAQKLIATHPDKKAKIEENLANFNRTLDEQGVKIKAQLANYSGKGFYVFHDAYGYFNDAYGLKQTGAFTINPLVAPGAQTLAHIKEEIAEHKVACLFAEPQFTPKVIETLSKNTGVHVGRLDPMGDSVKLGKNAYANFLQFTADSYAECLSK